MDIISSVWPSSVYILFQPKQPYQDWKIQKVGSINPDRLVSVSVADIDQDGDKDIFSGSYSLGSRNKDDTESSNRSYGSVVWFQNNASKWEKNNILRRKRGMYDKWIPIDLDNDKDIDFIGTRGNSEPYDGVIWLEQMDSRSSESVFFPARNKDSAAIPFDD